MSVRLYYAPAGAGKTRACLQEVLRLRRQDALAVIWVCLPNYQQLKVFERRLAASGGALGVTLGTFYELYEAILQAAGQPYPRITEPVQLALIAHLLQTQPLQHYAGIAHLPGFQRRVLQLIQELKQGRASPADFAREVAGRGPRLEELASLYLAYQERLRALGLADLEGLGWLAVEVLEAQPDLFNHLPFLAVDGFDQLSPVQRTVLGHLTRRLPETWITLTGDLERPQRQAHRRFRRAGEALERELGVRGEGLPSALSEGASPLRPPPHPHLETPQLDGPRTPIGGSGAPSETSPTTWGPGSGPQAPTRSGVPAPLPLPGLGPPPQALSQEVNAPGLWTLEAGLFEAAAQAGPGQGVTLLEAASPLEEVRGALRWLKALLLPGQGLEPRDCCVMARNLETYRPFLFQTAREFGLPLHLAAGFTLRENPAVGAVMELLSLPVGSESGPELRVRPLLDVWRSPYFDLCGPGIGPHDAQRLEAAARWGQVTGGLEQWRETLRRLAGRSPVQEDEEGRAGRPPVADEARRLLGRFERFVALLQPQGDTIWDYVGWVERLIGQDPALEADEAGPAAGEEGSLNVVRQVRDLPDEELVGRDVEALRALKDVLRGLVLAESIVGPRPLAYAEFLDRLRQAVERTTYSPEHHGPKAAVLAADAERVRGARFAAVALLGLAEGVFPRSRPEDPLLRDEDRQALAVSLAVEVRQRDEEPTHFYEAVTRASQALLLTRPYLTETGEPWEASPYWAHVEALLDGGTAREKAPERHLPPPEQAASWSEALAALARGGRRLAGSHPRLQDWQALQAGRQVLEDRLRAEATGPYEGTTPGLEAGLRRRFAGETPWSASRLETYGQCPHYFFSAYGLELEPREPIRPGFDVAQLGSIYHAILERTYAQDGDPRERVVGASAEVLETAPERFGFRRTELWEVQRREIERRVRETVEALEEQRGTFAPRYLEASFGFPERPQPLPALELEGPAGEAIRLRGIIDRVDEDPDGGVRLIDYKLGSSPTAGDLKKLRRVQLALYALAVERVLGLPRPRQALYWHVRAARSTAVDLSQGGLQRVEARVREMVEGVLAGRFEPEPPERGCPDYCPASAYCWRFAPPSWWR